MSQIFVCKEINNVKLSLERFKKCLGSIWDLGMFLYQILLLRSASTTAQELMFEFYVKHHKDQFLVILI